MDVANNPAYPSWKTYPTTGGSPIPYPNPVSINSIRAKLGDEDVWYVAPSAPTNKTDYQRVITERNLYKTVTINPTRASRNLAAHGE